MPFDRACLKLKGDFEGKALVSSDEAHFPLHSLSYGIKNS